MSNNDIKKTSQSVWGASPAGWTFGEGQKPGSQAFFENVLKKRTEYEQPWLFEIVPFAETRSKKVLELGCGAGYDAYTFCKHQANYVGIDITPQNPHRVKQHLGHYEMSPKVLVGDAENLMFPDTSFDIAYSNGVLHCTPDMLKSFQEIHRVLRPGGEFWVTVYYKHSVFYWISVVLSNYILRGGFRKRSLQDELARVEFTTSDQLPLVNVYSRREMKNFLEDTGYRVNNIWVRKLVVEDVALLPRVVVERLPLKRLSRLFGWYVICHATKM